MSRGNSRVSNWVLDQGRRAVAAGQARSVVVKRGEKVLVQVPLITGVAGLVPAALLAPQITVLAAAAALLARCKVEVVPTTDHG